MQKILKAPTLIGIRKAVLEYSFENFTNLDKKKNGKDFYASPFRSSYSIICSILQTEI